MKGKAFVGEVADRFGCDERRAETLIFAVFQELRDRLTPRRLRMWPLSYPLR
jgi:uncharacterized protein (DUF2267 family)